MDIQVSSNFERLLFDFYENGKMIEKLFYKLENTKEVFSSKNSFKKYEKNLWLWKNIR